MSEIEMVQCDQCGKRTDDRYDEKGWILIEPSSGEVQISISKGRGKDGCAKTRFYSGTRGDFCCEKCLIEWMRRLPS